MSHSTETPSDTKSQIGTPDTAHPPHMIVRVRSTGTESPDLADFENDPKKQLRKQIKDCKLKSKNHSKAHDHIKNNDENLGLLIAMLSPVPMIILILAADDPHAVTAATVISGLSFVLGRASAALKYTDKYISHKLSQQQYSNLAREMTTELSRLKTPEDVAKYADTVNDRIDIIEDNELEL